MKLATAQAQATPFGTDDTEEIARTIGERFATFTTMSMVEKRAALSEVVERIKITRKRVCNFRGPWWNAGSTRNYGPA
jgi:hypothetical protein